MLLKTIWILILLYFAYVAVRSLIHAVRTDSMAQRRVDPRTNVRQNVPPPRRPRQPESQPRAYRPPVEDVQDAKWKDL